MSFIPNFSNKTQVEIINGIKDLKINDPVDIHAGFALLKDSEFLQILNYYIMKRYENGVHRRHFKNRFYYRFVNDQFGMLEPEPLGFNNLMFPTMVLGIAAATGKE